MKKNFLPYLLIFLFFMMLLCSSLTFNGALKGLNLWLFTVLPSLLPYMIISSFMTENGTFKYLSRFLSPVTKHIFRLSENCGYVILLGFLCGYPIGSKLSADLVKKKQISVREGQILISFCNNVSPAFIVTYLINNIISLPAYRHILMAVMIAVPLLCGIFFSRLSLYFCHGKENKSGKSLPEKKNQPVESQTGSLDYCIISGFENIFKLGGYIILFSILSEFISSALSGSPLLQNRICSALEITSGLNTYAGNHSSSSVLLTECPAFTAFGGLCCLAQTYSMIKGSGLRLWLYFSAKLFIAVITYLLCTLIYLFLL